MFGGIVVVMGSGGKLLLLLLNEVIPKKLLVNETGSGGSVADMDCDRASGNAAVGVAVIAVGVITSTIWSFRKVHESSA